MASSTLAVGTAAAFIFSSAVLGLMPDRRDSGAQTIGAGWTLRGSFEDIGAIRVARRPA